MMESLVSLVRHRLGRSARLRRVLDSVGLLSAGRRLRYLTLQFRRRMQVRLLDSTVRFHVSSRTEIERIDNFPHEERLVRRIMECLEPGDVFCDVGANIGVISLCVAQAMTCEGLRVHAIEPESGNFAKLVRNIRANRAEARVSSHLIALAERSGVIRLYVTPGEASGTHSTAGPVAGGQRIEEVSAESFAAFADRIGTVPNVVKIDVEGAELSVLRGMRTLLGPWGVRDLLIELHPAQLAARGESVGDVRRLLAERGYHRQWQWVRGREAHEHYAYGGSDDGGNSATSHCPERASQ